MGVMPEYSVAPDGRFATNAFFYLQLPGTTAA
jgi:hypothetical protein